MQLSTPFDDDFLRGEKHLFSRRKDNCLCLLILLITNRMKKISIALLACVLIVVGYVIIKTPKTGPLAPSPEMSMVGKDLPKLTVQFLKEQIDVSGKPILIDFWATLCPPCIESMPHLNEIYKKYRAQGLEVIGITDEDKETVGKFLEQLPVDYPIAIDPGSKYSDLVIPDGIIPHVFLVNKKGEIVWEGKGYPIELKDSDIENILK